MNESVSKFRIGRDMQQAVPAVAPDICGAVRACGPAPARRLLRLRA